MSFIDKIKSDPKAQEIMKKYAKAASAQDAVKAYTEMARELGYDLTEDELKALVEEKEEARRMQTQAAADQIEKLEDEVLDNVAGGGRAEHDECFDTYMDYENCWFMDGCDNALLYYDEYKCARHNLDRQTI